MKSHRFGLLEVMGKKGVTGADADKSLGLLTALWGFFGWVWGMWGSSKDRGGCKHQEVTRFFGCEGSFSTYQRLALYHGFCLSFFSPQKEKQT